MSDVPTQARASSLPASTPVSLPTRIPLGFERQWMEDGSSLTGAEGSGQIPVWLQQVLGCLVWRGLQGTGAGAGAGGGSSSFCWKKRKIQTSVSHSVSGSMPWWYFFITHFLTYPVPASTSLLHLLSPWPQPSPSPAPLSGAPLTRAFTHLDGAHVLDQPVDAG